MPSFDAFTSPGVYSANKLELKAAWAALGYRYKGGYSAADKNPNPDEPGSMHCIWAPAGSNAIRTMHDLGIYAVFHGHGGPAEFHVICRDVDLQALKDCFEGIGGVLADVRRALKEDGSEIEGVLARAKAQVERLFSWPVREKGEPDLFWQRRKEKAQLDFDSRVQLAAEEFMEKGIELSPDHVPEPEQEL